MCRRRSIAAVFFSRKFKWSRLKNSPYLRALLPDAFFAGSCDLVYTTFLAFQLSKGARP